MLKQIVVAIGKLIVPKKQGGNGWIYRCLQRAGMGTELG